MQGVREAIKGEIMSRRKLLFTKKVYQAVAHGHAPSVVCPKNMKNSKLLAIVRRIEEKKS